MFNPKVTLNIKKEKLESLINSVSKGVPIRIALEKASIPPYYYFSWLKLYNEFIDEMDRNGVIYNDLEELEPKPYYDTKGNVAGYYYTPISIIDKIKKCHAEFIEATHDKVVAGVRDNQLHGCWKDVANKTMVKKSKSRIRSLLKRLTLNSLIRTVTRAVWKS